MWKNKKGYSLAELAPIAITLVVIAIVLSFGANILDEIQEDQTTDEHDWNASERGLESLATVADWLPTVALIVVAAIIIGIIVTYFKFR